MSTSADAKALDRPEDLAFLHGAKGPARRVRNLPSIFFSARLGGAGSALVLGARSETDVDTHLDPAGILADRARRLYPSLRVETSPAPPDAPEGSFDRVLAAQPLDGPRLSAIARLLAPRGLLVTSLDPPGDDQTLEDLTQATESSGLRRLEGPGRTVAVFFRPPAPTLPAPRRVVISLLTWNTRDISLESVEACVREARMLRRLGHEPFLVVCDNGSTDGTREALLELEGGLDVPHRFLLGERNRGSSVARNEVLDVARDEQADYVLFLDGDLEPVPFSSFAMLRHLEDAPAELACVGAHCHHQTRRRKEAAPCLWSVGDHPVADDRDDLWVAWTQYGLFRHAVFEAGARFDVRPPFDRPGWGCEDVDLAFQVHRLGYYFESFTGMVYLHRNLSSSVPLLRQLGVDPSAEYARRLAYVIEKWQDAGLGEKTLDFLRRESPEI